MTGIFSKCIIICGKFFDSKKQLRTHKYEDHRITDSKIRSVLILEKTTKQVVAASVKTRYPREQNLSKSVLLILSLVSLATRYSHFIKSTSSIEHYH